VLSSFEGSKVVIVEPQVCFFVLTSSHSFGAAELGMSLSLLFLACRTVVLPFIPVSKSQLGYSRMVKEKVAEQLHKNKELFTEVVAKIPTEGGGGLFQGDDRCSELRFCGGVVLGRR
jgi:hypothetical protein